MIVGVCVVRDAVDVIRPVIENMLAQVDHVMVADNLSTDGTREILDSLPIDVLDDPDPAHYQGRKMTALAHAAADEGAEWVVPFDADELWYSPFGRIGDVLTDLAPQWFCAAANLYDHVPTARDDNVIDPTRRIGWRRRAPGALPKVACRIKPDLIIDDGNHQALYEGGATVYPKLLVVRHFPYRSPEQFVAKARMGAAALGATDLPESVGQHWRDYGRLLESRGPEVLEEVFREHFWSADPESDPSLIYDPAWSSLGAVAVPTAN